MLRYVQTLSCGGRGGIRTPTTFRVIGFQDRGDAQLRFTLPQDFLSHRRLNLIRQGIKLFHQLGYWAIRLVLPIEILVRIPSPPRRPMPRPLA